MGLQTQAPPRMLEAIPDGELGVAQPIGAVHRLHEEVRERQVLEPSRIETRLREDQFELVAPLEDMLRSPETALSAFEPLLGSRDPWVRALARLRQEMER